MKLLITILVTFLLSTGTYTTKAVRISNGDTLTVLIENKKYTKTWLECRDKVELPDNSRKPDLFSGYMARLNELENSG